VSDPIVRRFRDLSQSRQDAWLGFLRAHGEITRTLDDALRERAELTLGEFDVLVQLAGGPAEGMRMTELARAVVLSPSGLTRRVASLERAGLVERVAVNARIVRSRLTTAGRAALARGAPVNLELVQSLFLAHLSDADAEALAVLWSSLGR
jgi:DNA-binding MarR family transcriptional regulator